MTFGPIDHRNPRGRPPIMRRVVLRSSGRPNCVQMVISEGLVLRLGFDRVARAEIQQGTGSDHGWIMLRPTAADNGVFLHPCRRQALINLSADFLAIQAPRHQTSLAFRETDDALLVDLRPLLTAPNNLPTTETRHDGESRQSS